MRNMTVPGEVRDVTETYGRPLCDTSTRQKRYGAHSKQMRHMLVT